MKVVKDLLKHYPDFQESRTILVDDTGRKMRDNIKELCIEIPTYSSATENFDTDPTLLEILPKIYSIRDSYNPPVSDNLDLDSRPDNSVDSVAEMIRKLTL